MTLLPYEDLKKRTCTLQPIENYLSLQHTLKRFNEEINKLIFDDRTPLFVRAPHSILKQDTNLYRVSSKFDNMDERKISFFHHPYSCKTNLGRCNIPKFPVFYCSDVCAVSLAEAVQKKLPINNEIYYISEWKVSTQISWKTLTLIFGDIPIQNPLYSFIEANRKKVIELYKNHLYEDDFDHYITFYNEEFTNPSSHKFSSITSHQFFYNGDENGDIILYPSIQVNKLGNNYAINKNYIENRTIRIQKVYKINIDYLDKVSYSKFIMKRVLISVAHPMDDKYLEWHKPNEEDFARFENFLLPMI